VTGISAKRQWIVFEKDKPKYDQHQNPTKLDYCMTFVAAIIIPKRSAAVASSAWHMLDG